MSGMREITVGTGSGIDAADVVLNIGPQHPSTHGMLRLRLVVDGDRIETAEPIVGYMHRGAEKLFEVRDYRQIIVLANRHDWLSAFANELGVVLAVERLMGMKVPERAVWLRMALAELNRALNHLMFLGSYPLEVGAIEPTVYAFRERETIQAVMEEASGGRLHYMFNRVGGLKEEVPGGWTTRARQAIGDVRRRLPKLDRLIRDNETFRARAVGVGVLSAENAAAYGVSGPVARASGLDLDLRRDEPYLAYGELAVPVITRTPETARPGSRCCWTRYTSRSIWPSCASVASTRSVDPSMCDCPKWSRHQRATPTPGPRVHWGSTAIYLVSRGDKTPWRMKLRTASFANVQALSTVLPGCLVADLVPILGSMFFVVGDIDK
jgi:NADH-quinone oxidoreductase subunit D